LNIAPSLQLSPALIPPLPSLIPSTSNVLKGSGVAGTASAAVPGTDYLAPGALPNLTTAVTQSPGDNSTKLATTAYVAAAEIPAIYTVGTLPSASGLGAGAQVIISDCTTYTPGALCTGGGTDYMIGISNGVAWTVH
jgi:hypothetical protein